MTKWFDYSHEDLTAGNPVPSDFNNGPYWFEYNDPPICQSDSIRSKFMQFDVPYTVGDPAWMGVYSNPNGIWGTTWRAANPITLVVGTTYYLALFLRQEMLGGEQVYTDDFNFDKLIEIRAPGILGTGFRWIIASGFRYLTYTASKYSFAVG